LVTLALESLGEHLLDLAWSLWGGLGVSSWANRHTEWAVEVEPLIVFTAHLGDHDRRLVGESIDWCVQHDRFVSLRQLRHILTEQPWPRPDDFARLSASVQAHTGRRWPQAESATPHGFELSGKSRLPDLDLPALLQLRLRAIFGVGARAEILRLLLVAPAHRWTLGELAQHVPYTRRQLSNEVEMLALGGVLRRVDRTGAATYGLADRSALVGLVGRMPVVAPRWPPLLSALVSLWAALARAGGARQPAVELRRQLRPVEPSLTAAGLQLPHDKAFETSEVLSWSIDLATALSQADAERLDAYFEPGSGIRGIE
jgi:hypothetical protein